MIRLVARKVWSDENVEIEAVEASEIHAEVAEGGIKAVALAKPVAIVIKGPDRQYAVDLESNPVDLGSLNQQLAGIDD